MVKSLPTENTLKPSMEYLPCIDFETFAITIFRASMEAIIPNVHSADLMSPESLAVDKIFLGVYVYVMTKPLTMNRILVKFLVLTYHLLYGSEQSARYGTLE